MHPYAWAEAALEYGNPRERREAATICAGALCSALRDLHGYVSPPFDAHLFLGVERHEPSVTFAGSIAKSQT